MVFRIHFFKIQKTFPWQVMQNAGEVILFTEGFPCVHSTTNCPTCENYITNYTNFQEHQLNSGRFPIFPGEMSNSRSCSSGVAGPLAARGGGQICHPFVMCDVMLPKKRKLIFGIDRPRHKIGIIPTKSNWTQPMTQCYSPGYWG